MNHDEIKNDAKSQVIKGQNIDQRLQYLQVESLDLLRETLSILNRSFENYVTSQDRLAARILSLNWILGILTAIGAIAGVISILDLVRK